MGSFARNKHIVIRRNYTLEGIQEKIDKPVHLDTSKQPADMLTKDKPYRLLYFNMKQAGMERIERAKT